jgi:hypothetical protein
MLRKRDGRVLLSTFGSFALSSVQLLCCNYVSRLCYVRYSPSIPLSGSSFRAMNALYPTFLHLLHRYANLSLPTAGKAVRILSWRARIGYSGTRWVIASLLAGKTSSSPLYNSIHSSLFQTSARALFPNTKHPRKTHNYQDLRCPSTYTPSSTPASHQAPPLFPAEPSTATAKPLP